MSGEQFAVLYVELFYTESFYETYIWDFCIQFTEILRRFPIGIIVVNSREREFKDFLGTSRVSTG
jgi:hypothetical protein